MARLRDEEILVREAHQGDLRALVELLAQLSLDEPREELRDPLPPGYAAAFDEIAADPNQEILVAARGGRVVGTCTVVVIPNFSHRGRPWALVENVVVDEDSRGNGVGEALMSRAREIARDAGAYKLSLTSNVQRVDAHRFYERIGFRPSHKGFSVEP